MGAVATVIITPRDSCNMACRYCVDPTARTNRQMSQTTLENALVKTVEYERRLHRGVRFIWHGGEPLLAGEDFYRRVIEITLRLRRDGFDVQHAMQTNGTLMSEKAAGFLHSQGFHVSFSLDGPQRLNDLTRVYRDGSSTFADALQGMEHMRAYGRRPNAICVVTSANIRHLPDVYRFFASQSIRSKFNPWYQVPDAVESLAITAEDFGSALSQVFDIWFAERNALAWGDNSFFEQILVSCLVHKPISCAFRNCQNDEIFAIDPSGNVGPCSRFAGEAGFVFGNVDDNGSFDVIAESPIRLHLRDRGQRIRECCACAYQPVCNSGCMHQAWAAYGTIDRKDPMCAAYRCILSHAERALDDSFAKATVRRQP